MTWRRQMRKNTKKLFLEMRSLETLRWQPARQSCGQQEEVRDQFWSCETGEGIMGKKYTQRVSDLCDAKVNASSGLVGHENMGGNWELDVMSHPRVPFSASGVQGLKVCWPLEMGVKGTSEFSKVARTSLPLEQVTEAKGRLGGQYEVPTTPLTFPNTGVTFSAQTIFRRCWPLTAPK